MMSLSHNQVFYSKFHSYLTALSPNSEGAFFILTLMAHKQKNIPTTIRFTEEERSNIEYSRGHLSISAYIRDCVLKNANMKSRRNSKSYSPSESRTLLAQILALLGKSRATGALREILDLARMGALPVTPELEAKISAACEDIRSIKQMLIKALGLKSGN
jgi:hypothetical protein